MNLTETHDLLTYVAALDNRRFGDDTVIAWQGILGDLPATDCREAVRRHFAKSTAYLLPAHVRDLALVVRDERRPKHEVFALPSRFEVDEGRVQQIRAGIAACARALSLAMDRRPKAIAAEAADLSPSEVIHRRALERARLERRMNRGAA